MPIKWIIADIDGCISPEESIPWDLELFAQFARISRDASAGRGECPPITLCTGRPQPYAEVLAKLLDIRAPIICENGAVIYSLHDNWARYGPGVTEEKLAGLRAVRAFIEKEIVPVYPRVLFQFGKEAHISIFSEHPEVFAEIRPQIEAHIKEKRLPPLHISPTHYYLNLSMDAVDKGHALHALMDDLYITRDEAAAIGDTEGDIPLREAAGFFACPANARPAVKEIADYVSPYPVLEGILDILAQPELRVC